MSATENKILNITLAVNANPKQTIQWTFKVDTSCNFSPLVSNTTSNGFLTSSSILIDKVRNSDFGEYTFTANNTVGMFFRRFEAIKRRSDEYTGVQKENPAFVDEYTTIQSEIEPRQPQEQSYNTYEEYERKTEANPYSNVNAIGSEAKHPQGHAIG
ncbi:unnamed protein product [Mytilus edulis]|uniref:Immunoglobulin I-set domain-containing protein n=1 Tax=Mytilus edulis TaxID=6550 RepID=A0A8S3QN74_MYTED|nr:unnamed protein product [Mytilus edulis]